MACSIIDNIFVIGQIFDNILLLSWEVLVLLLLTIVGFGLTGREGGCRCNFLSMLWCVAFRLFLFMWQFGLIADIVVPDWGAEQSTCDPWDMYYIKSEWR